MNFRCPDHGQVQPERIGYSFPATGWCPVCNRQLTEILCGFPTLTEAEAKQIRPDKPEVQDAPEGSR